MSSRLSAPPAATFTLLIDLFVLDELPTRVEIGGVVLVSAGMVLALGLYDRAVERRARAS